MRVADLNFVGRSMRIGNLRALLTAAVEQGLRLVETIWFVPVLVLMIHWPIVIGNDRPAFRDVGHFYTPLYQYVSERQSIDWLPLWNPLDQTGMPVIGESTTALFYPVRFLVYQLPVDASVAIGWYVLIHLVLAALTARWVVMQTGARRLLGNLAALMYVMSGSVLFLYCNPPFLVGAAWLPLALAPLVAPSIDHRQSIISGVAMSMMILGGDPQAAFHVMIIASLVHVVRWSQNRCWSSSDVAKRILLPPVIAALLACPQIAGSFSWASQSDRLTDIAISNPSGDQESAWWQAPKTSSRKYESYQFSLPPWHLAELAAPMPFGKLLPTYQRWSSLIPGDGQVWTPTIYMGGLAFITLLLGPFVGSSSAGTPSAKVWWWIAIGSLLASLGWFGIVWVLQNLTGKLAGIDSAIGGVYWVLYQFVPGYDAFRYPTKWLPLFSLATAIWTAGLLENLSKESRWKIAILAGVLFIVSAGGSLLFTIDGVAAMDRLGITGSTGNSATTIRDEFWGPLSIENAATDLAMSLGHATVTFAFILLMMTIRTDRWRRVAITAIAVATMAEVTVANIDLVASIPLSAETTLVTSLPTQRDRAIDPTVLDNKPLSQVVDLAKDPSQQGEDQPSSPNATPQDWSFLRTQADGGWPTSWQRTSSANRLLEVEASSHADWFGRWHLADGQAVFNGMSTMKSRHISEFWNTTNRMLATKSGDERRAFWLAVRHWLRLRGQIHQTGQDQSLTIDEQTFHLSKSVMGITSTFNPPIRLDVAWQTEASLSMENLLTQVVASGGKPTPTIVADASWIPDTIPATIDTDTQSDASQVDVVEQSADSLTLRVQCLTPILLHRPTLQDGHWQARIRPLNAGRDEWKTAVVHRVDLLGQGVIIPAGHWHVELTYRPSWLVPSLVVAVVAWAMLLATVLRGKVVAARRQKS